MSANFEDSKIFSKVDPLSRAIVSACPLIPDVVHMVVDYCEDDFSEATQKAHIGIWFFGPRLVLIKKCKSWIFGEMGEIVNDIYHRNLEGKVVFGMKFRWARGEFATEEDWTTILSNLYCQAPPTIGKFILSSWNGTFYKSESSDPAFLDISAKQFRVSSAIECIARAGRHIVQCEEVAYNGVVQVGMIPIRPALVDRSSRKSRRSEIANILGIKHRNF